MDFNFTVAQNDADLQGIIELQRHNLLAGISPEEAASQGFVTVVHTLEILRDMNAVEQHIICKNNQQVIAYLLAMTIASKEHLPILIPMFEQFDRIIYRGKLIADYHYIVVGQVCVSKDFRGQGVLDQCYEYYQSVFKSSYDFAITEIATRNIRSVKAHKRIGFTEVSRYTSPEGEEWSIVLWDWQD